MAKRKRNQETCRCQAYPFPHRRFSGKCQGTVADDPWQAIYDRDRDVDDLMEETWVRR